MNKANNRADVTVAVTVEDQLSERFVIILQTTAVANPTQQHPSATVQQAAKFQPAACI